MAKISSKSILAFLCILISTVFAGRDMPPNSKNEAIKHPDTFKLDGNIHIPKLWRVKIPNYIKGFNPITYNPAPGTNTGIGIVGGTGQRYIPGGDDTLVPNPGVEIPIPGTTRGNAHVSSATHP